MVAPDSLARGPEFNLLVGCEVKKQSEVSALLVDSRKKITEMNLFFTHSDNKSRLFLLHEIINQSGFVPKIWGVQEIRDDLNRAFKRQLWNISDQEGLELVELPKEEISQYQPPSIHKDMSCSWKPSSNRFHVRISIPKKILNHTSNKKWRRKIARKWQDEILASVTLIRQHFGFFAVYFTYNQLSESNSITQSLRTRFNEEYVREG